MDAPTIMPTVGEIARRLGVPIHRVEYVLRTRDIAPLAMAGNARIYAESDVDRVASELHRIDADRVEGMG